VETDPPIVTTSLKDGGVLPPKYQAVWTDNYGTHAEVNPGRAGNPWIFDEDAGANSFPNFEPLRFTHKLPKG
jgi:hypothetical protein